MQVLELTERMQHGKGMQIPPLHPEVEEGDHEETGLNNEGEAQQLQTREDHLDGGVPRRL